MSEILPYLSVVTSLGFIFKMLLPPPTPYNRSTPPYLVLNRCRDVVINLRQQAAEGALRFKHDDKVGWDVFSPDPLKQPKPVPYALDEPNGAMLVQVCSLYSLDSDSHR